MAKITVSVIKADVGSLAGHHVVHPKQIEAAKNKLNEAKETGLIIDYYVFNCGDDLELLMTHRRGENNSEVHKLAWNTFKEVTEKVSKPLKLYAAGQDLLAEAFSGNIRGMGPGVAELEFEERPSDPIIIFAADKTEPGAWNLPLFKVFADPFNTAGLVIDPRLHQGFKFIVLDVMEGMEVEMICPEEMYDLLALIGTPSRYVISKVYRRDGLPAAAASTTRLSLIAGRYVGKDDPVCIVRAQKGLPAVGEILEAFAFPHLVAGWMRGSHNGPLMPVSLKNAKCTRFDGPPRVVALGFQLRDGYLVGPADLFDDPVFDWSRRMAMEIADYLRRHGPFMPHRLGPDEMEYTTLPQVLEKLKNRFRKAE
ncbi:MAG: fructose 1,6-bisphosphatase [Candidatus Methanomethylicota archaeon]|uniref:Fructose-1,6-bisphosphate aldolase/phosphatase n=1 Tax=Thermoproteota archaeon TaxID=2056631 RepID=A0A497ET75_9CREN|nr:MAG: fructose 1,6-bisphosphatase [Candidatus Verstraetearchaeota archaeon]